MVTSVRKSASPASTWFEGAVCVPSACRRKCSTIEMRRNGVIDITIAGSSVSTVSRMMICIGVLKELCPAGSSDGNSDGDCAGGRREKTSEELHVSAPWSTTA